MLVRPGDLALQPRLLDRLSVYLPVGACDRGGCGLGDALCRCMVYDGVDR
jgi:hypothetical protein